MRKTLFLVFSVFLLFNLVRLVMFTTSNGDITYLSFGRLITLFTDPSYLPVFNVSDVLSSFLTDTSIDLGIFSFLEPVLGALSFVFTLIREIVQFVYGVVVYLVHIVLGLFTVSPI